MAKYQAYAEYKDSGVEWLGEIPSHWDLRKFKHHFRSAMGETILGADLIEDGKLPVYSATEGDHFFGYVNSSSVVLEKGDFVIPARGNSIGFPKLVVTTSTCSQTTIYAKMHKKIHSKFTFYYLLGCKPYLFQFVQTAIPQITVEEVKNNHLVHPSLEEQIKIANFLDYETAKIDHLIEKQQRLIELLKEKRQAVISHAVTKGVDPNVLMKDSGVEWLGEVPEHWQLVPLKYLCTFSGGGTPTKDNLSYWTDGNIPWVSPKDMKTFWISETQDYITEKAVKESSTNTVEQNSLLMVVRSGILQRTIPIAINTVPVTMNQDMKALKFGKRVLVEYIANLIHGNTVQLLLEWSKEGATVESIEHEYLANSLIPVPSLKEQEEITQVIAKKMKVYAELTEKAELQITLLQERRTALISAAVTGKIDVRNWQAPTLAGAQTELSA
ncbi:restriction endonuclease subunit S [Acinetobacter baumannii]|uniref:restriction endonuclease subunit S n=1 Tax=Acinetobacter baumannii TaxID=470 RepID=UPI001FB3FB1D|nr:restriction endonuclease subunit S [Acinetobacter baumannii]MCW1488603.1 restriction endonuclease subunit S [Acinetobacter baumannii]MCZ3356403.1 restriction endonuclease subunit S [Acinetobacter baumannii]MDC4640080.1 restriction endonuclease subunit S [Acinetobacter baumannii]MDV4242642.1 restriction endonuclease subunit S [Acinetobacter baumannii]UOE71913.1 restriction endonuclease subunit S [Acinetobacter baumannii]